MSYRSRAPSRSGWSCNRLDEATSLELVTASEAHRQAELNLALQEFGVVKARIVAVLVLATCPC